ncbi:response regulator [Sulfurovum sp. ST-21]|uniref:histidine kinase n=1 Tax=Sulfurovum indicum TaxID=2779528 RepID=A0A7M1S3F7_9BACT|nr:hybrid sensor histidine kinase/response regulator [Sulfurovum indicum]QOR61963.1 hybrid sensor histidine kinase/response regulator [Sulfurovum indicum]
MLEDENVEKKPYIMAIDDTPYNLEVLRVILMDTDAEVACVESGREAIGMIRERVPDLILLDIMMPEMDGFEVCEILKRSPETNSTPIIFLSALDDINSKVKAFEVGGVDYITKPFNTLEVVARVKTHLKLHYMLEEMNTLLRESFHEIYTPLGLIKSSLSLLELEQGDNEHLQNIKSSVQSLHSIYEDIYYAIKKEVRSYPPEWIDLEAFLNKRIELFKPQMKYKRLKCEITSEIESPMIRINLTELERLMDNLLSNAIKYANEESIVKIEITLSGEKIRLAVSNSSKKIKDPKKLFEKLYREDHSVMGLGIGLSIVRKICDKYDIDIDVESNEHITSFILYYEEK